ncbi:hypothetical protein NJ7G_0338 [Natrinema sp. J7-2]|nr:hypothetical protein NJ7G_0338 [Natrinema sp. J7-2]
MIGESRVRDDTGDSARAGYHVGVARGDSTVTTGHLFFRSPSVTA